MAFDNAFKFGKFIFWIVGAIGFAIIGGIIYMCCRRYSHENGYRSRRAGPWVAVSPNEAQPSTVMIGAVPSRPGPVMYPAQGGPAPYPTQYYPTQQTPSTYVPQPPYPNQMQQQTYQPSAPYANPAPDLPPSYREAVMQK